MDGKEARDRERQREGKVQMSDAYHTPAAALGGTTHTLSTHSGGK